jgi:hypothetical protein
MCQIFVTHSPKDILGGGKKFVVVE